MNIKSRQKILGKCSGVVIKVGTRLLTDTAIIRTLIGQISKIREKTPRVLLVSSGAVGLGMKTVGLEKRPSKLSEIQALAAIGQGKLMSQYEAECANHGFHAGQLLLTASDINDRERHLNVANCINSLWANNVLPIINENDSVSVDELKFGDNDCLAALISVMTKTELTIILTTVDGLQMREDGKLGKRISFVKSIDEDIRGMATSTDDKNFSIGGMASKIRAAEIVTSAGEYLWIANGKDPEILTKIFQGEDVGTLFAPPSDKQMHAKQRWLSFFSKPSGKILIDAGAVKALTERGRSLLPSGVKSVSGTFSRGDTVSICSENGKIIGKGLVNYSSEEATSISGRKSSQIFETLGYEGDEEVVHRNNLVLNAQ